MHSPGCRNLCASDKIVTNRSMIFMNRVRQLVLAAHRSVTHKEREKILISHFILGLYNNSLALQISTMSPTTAEKEERMATAGDALRAEQRARRAAGGYVAPEVDDYDSGGEGCQEPEDECEYEEDDDCELSAAAPESNPRRFVAKPSFGGGRGGTGPGRCFHCGQLGHIKAHRPSIRNPPPSRNRGAGGRPITCDLCIGPHS